MREELLSSYNDTVSELDRMFNTIKAKLTDEHYRSKEELRKFLEKEIDELGDEEKGIMEELEKNEKEKSRVQAILDKIEREKKVEENV